MMPSSKKCKVGSENPQQWVKSANYELFTFKQTQTTLPQHFPNKYAIASETKFCKLARINTKQQQNHLKKEKESIENQSQHGSELIDTLQYKKYVNPTFKTIKLIAMKGDQLVLALPARFSPAGHNQTIYQPTKNSQYDFHIVVGSDVINAHKEALKHSRLLQEKILIGENICVVKESLKKVLHVLYGEKIKLSRQGEVEKILEVVKILRIPDLQRIIRDDFLHNFDSYPLLGLLKLAERYDYAELKNICEEELINDDFEQMNYEKYQLLQLNIETFKQLILLHQKHKLDNTMIGLTQENIKLLVSEYETFNHQTINLPELLKKAVMYPSLAKKFTDSDSYKIRVSLAESDNITRKRHPTWSFGCSLTPKNGKKSKENSDLSNISSQSTIQMKKMTIEGIKAQNEKMSQSNLHMISELQEVQNCVQRCCNEDKIEGDEEDLRRKLQELQEISAQEAERLKDLSLRMDIYLSKQKPKNRSSQKLEDNSTCHQKALQQDRKRRASDQYPNNFPVFQSWKLENL